MARGRMLSWTVSIDRKLARLSSPLARLLFTWMLAHADNLGRLRGDPAYVRATVIPLEPGISDERVEAWLSEMADLGLIFWYSINEARYLQFCNWSKHQDLSRIGLKRSEIPAPQFSPEPDRLRQNLTESGSEVEGEGKGNVNVKVKENVKVNAKGKEKGNGEEGTPPLDMKERARLQREALEKHLANR